MLLNDGVWHERTMLSFHLARELCATTGVQNETLTGLFNFIEILLDVTGLFNFIETSLDVTYKTLRERRDYIDYRAVDDAGADHLECMGLADRASSKMRPLARNHRQQMNCKVIEAENKNMTLTSCRKKHQQQLPPSYLEW